MTLALVQHFLNDEGQRRYPDWLRRVAAEASRYGGFISQWRGGEAWQEKQSARARHPRSISCSYGNGAGVGG